MNTLINKRAVKRFALDASQTRHHKFSRVSDEFLARIEGIVRRSVKEHVHRLPSVGKTIRCLLPVVVALGLTGCGDKGPDMGPVGAGLSVIGLGIVIGATIIALLGKKGGGNE
jgi:hypothetical protein